MRHVAAFVPTFLLFLLSACSAPRAGTDAATEQAAFRVPVAGLAGGSGPLGTIFSPLNLPKPDSIRTAAGEPGPDYWQQRVDYDIDATLDPAARTLTASAVITYHNRSPDHLRHLWLHLEQNLFRRGSDGDLIRGRGGRFGNRDGFEGGVTLTAVRDASSDAPLTLSVYDTVARLELPAPLAPRADYRFRVEWTFPVPAYGSDRLGIETVAQGTIFQLAQWYPAVAAYDDVYAWNTLPYLGQGEFYTNFGNYNVRLTVPRSHLVFASGWLTNPETVLTPAQRERLDKARAAAANREVVMVRGPEEVADAASRPPGEGPLTWAFRALDVRTFAFASSDAFIWDAAFIPERAPSPSEKPGANGPADAGDQAAPRGTLVQSAYPREALPLWSQSTDMLRSSIEGYNRRWHTYPYPVATNCNGIVGGMEYPMLIYCRERSSDRGLYGVTTHEIGHNWFPMLVNTDERRHAWMDEGFNSFINYYSTQEKWGDSKGHRGEAEAIVPFMREPAQQPIETNADRVMDGRLGNLQYAKTAAGLVLLREQILGPERFDRAFRAYIHAWAFRSPRPWDFFRCIENHAGEDLAWFWRGWFLSTGTLDQAVESVVQPAPDAAPVVTFANRGALVMPVVYRLDFADGSHATRRLPVEAWAWTDRRILTIDPPGKLITRLTIDPERVFPDTDRSNNVWARPGPNPSGD